MAILNLLISLMFDLRVPCERLSLAVLIPAGLLSVVFCLGVEVKRRQGADVRSKEAEKATFQSLEAANPVQVLEMMPVLVAAPTAAKPSVQGHSHPEMTENATEKPAEGSADEALSVQRAALRQAEEAAEEAAEEVTRWTDADIDAIRTEVVELRAWKASMEVLLMGEGGAEGASPALKV